MCFMLARVYTPSSPIRERGRERERGSERERERERERGREKERVLVLQCLSLLVTSTLV